MCVRAADTRGVIWERYDDDVVGGRTVTDTTEDWQHAAAVLNARMDELGMSQTRLSSEAGVSQQLLRELRSGEARQYRASGLARIAVALGWPHDAFQRLRHGGPVEERRRIPHAARTEMHLAASQFVRRIDDIERQLTELRTEIVRLLAVDDSEAADLRDDEVMVD